MRKRLTITALVLFTFCVSLTSANAGGPFGLFDRDTCCDSVSCDTSTCDSGCCNDDGCDGTLRESRDHGSLQSHLLANLFRSDCCSRNYISVIGGWNDLNDYNGEQDNSPPVFPAPPAREGSFDDGWAIGTAIGRRFNQAIRAEFEFAFRSNAADQWTVSGVPAVRWNGDFHAYSLMANLYHDFANVNWLGWSPYVGAGIGIAFLDGDFQTSTLNLEISEELLAYQFMAGASKTLTSAIDLFVEYRYFATSDFELINNTASPSVAFGTDPYEADLAIVGFRISR